MNSPRAELVVMLTPPRLGIAPSSLRQTPCAQGTHFACLRSSSAPRKTKKFLILSKTAGGVQGGAAKN